MSWKNGVGAVVLGASLASGVAWAQAAAPQSQGVTKTGVRGDVTVVDATGGMVTIKTADGSSSKVVVDVSTQYLGVEPGKTSLDGAARLTLADLKAGDKVWARGTTTRPDGALVARQVITISATAIQERNQRDARDWQSRGVFGEVVTVDAATKTITVESRRGGKVTVNVGTTTKISRLKAGSMELSGATPIGLGDLKAGDQVAVRGDRAADGSSIAAETVLTGDFPRREGGRVVAVDAAKREIQVSSRDGKSSTIVLTDKTMLRAFAPQAGGRPEGGGRAGGEAGGFRNFGFGPEERAELERRTQPLELKQIQPGDFIFAVAEPGSPSGTIHAAVVIKVTFPNGRPPSRADGGQWDITPGSGPQ